MDGIAASPLSRVTIVTVAYDSAAVLEGFLRACPPEAAVIVVDNASRDGSADLAESLGARVLRQPRNGGFGAGCNAGLDAVDREFVLLANPDSRLTADAVTALVEAADAFPGAALLAPLLRDENGDLVRSWDVPQARRRQMRPRQKYTDPWPEGPTCTGYVSGACLLVRASAGLRFDERYFLYFEDDDFCESARAAGHSLIIVPRAVVTHAGGRSTEPTAAMRRFKAHHLALSRLVHAEKWQGVEVARAEAWRWLLRHAGKALGHALSFGWQRLPADIGGVGGSLAWLRSQRRRRRA